MEFAGLAETKRFAAGRGLELLNISAGGATTEYLFRRHGSRNHWDAILAARPSQPLRGPFEHRRGHAYTCQLEESVAGDADYEEAPRRSRLMLYEDASPLGFAHQNPAHIAAHGGGRYVHRKDELIFSASDGSDPNANGRQYSIRPDFL